MNPSMGRSGGWFGRVIAAIRRGHGSDLSPVPEPRHLLDALRRSTELLDGMEPSNGTAYWREERDYIISVNRRLLREHDPDAQTDRAVR